MNGVTRRFLIKNAALAAAACKLNPRLMAQPANEVMPGKFKPTWESLKQWRMPDWFRDAKFGIWAHWSAQCVPEQGDWYARRMYIEGDPCYDFHVKTYGHPTKVGFKEIDHLWKAERWEPEKLMDLYVKTGAKYFMALACHHDNLDCFDSTHHKWNTMNVGPKKDIVGTWEKLVRARGLRFSVSNHSSHSWHWFQTAYGYDLEGPLAGQRYDAYTLTKADGKGKWWDGLDPQELYTGRNMVMPDGIKTIAEANAWHKQNDGRWLETVPPNNPEFVRTWYLRCKELIDKYKPDMLYLDDEELPLGQAGLDLTAHFYNASAKWHGGETQAVVSAKEYTPAHMGATMLDIERGRAKGIMDAPWQTDTCIGEWHYKRSLYTEHKYKTPGWVAQALVDIVSKNGNLMLNIPVRGDGTIDEDEYKFLDEFGRWMRVHGDGIYDTRPFKIYGEGLPDAADSHNFNENKGRKFDASDIRFTTKGDTLYVFALGWPESGKLKVKSLAKGNSLYPKPIRAVEMFGSQGRLQVKQDAEGLEITLPAKPADHLGAYGFKVLT